MLWWDNGSRNSPWRWPLAYPSSRTRRSSQVTMWRATTRVAFGALTQCIICPLLLNAKLRCAGRRGDGATTGCGFLAALEVTVGDAGRWLSTVNESVINANSRQQGYREDTRELHMYHDTTHARARAHCTGPNRLLSYCSLPFSWRACCSCAGWWRRRHAVGSATWSRGCTITASCCGRCTCTCTVSTRRCVSITHSCLVI